MSSGTSSSARAAATASVTDLFSRIYREARDLGFPAFLYGEERSNPLNASPYVAPLTDLGSLQHSGERAALVAKLNTALDELRHLGAKPRLLLLGGSMLDLGGTPSDLDCVVFYSGEQPDAEGLGRWQASKRAERLDLRAIPMDGDPLLLLKSAIFFSSLYSRRKHLPDQLRGCVLVDCSR